MHADDSKRGVDALENVRMPSTKIEGGTAHYEVRAHNQRRSIWLFDRRAVLCPVFLKGAPLLVNQVVVHYADSRSSSGWKRYSDFDRLRQSLKKKHGAGSWAASLAFPKKTHFGSKKAPAVTERRRAELEAWLNQVLAHKDDLLMQFLGSLSAQIAATGSMSSGAPSPSATPGLIALAAVPMAAAGGSSSMMSAADQDQEIDEEKLAAIAATSGPGGARAGAAGAGAAAAAAAEADTGAAGGGADEPGREKMGQQAGARPEGPELEAVHTQPISSPLAPQVVVACENGTAAGNGTGDKGNADEKERVIQAMCSILLSSGTQGADDGLLGCRLCAQLYKSMPEVQMRFKTVHGGVRGICGASAGRLVCTGTGASISVSIGKAAAARQPPSGNSVHNSVQPVQGAETVSILQEQHVDVETLAGRIRMLVLDAPSSPVKAARIPPMYQRRFEAKLVLPPGTKKLGDFLRAVSIDGVRATTATGGHMELAADADWVQTDETDSPTVSANADEQQEYLLGTLNSLCDMVSVNEGTFPAARIQQFYSSLCP